MQKALPICAQVCNSDVLSKRWAEGSACQAEPMPLASPKRRKVATAGWAAVNTAPRLPGLGSLKAPCIEQDPGAELHHTLATHPAQPPKMTTTPPVPLAPAMTHALQLLASSVLALARPPVPRRAQSRSLAASPAQAAAKAAAAAQALRVDCRFGAYATKFAAAFAVATSAADFSRKTGLATGDARRNQPKVHPHSPTSLIAG